MRQCIIAAFIKAGQGMEGDLPAAFSLRLRTIRGDLVQIAKAEIQPGGGEIDSLLSLRRHIAKQCFQIGQNRF